jgi:hypothetical protein
MSGRAREPNDGSSTDGPLNYAPKRVRLVELDPDSNPAVAPPKVDAAPLSALRESTEPPWRRSKQGATFAGDIAIRQQARAGTRPASRTVVALLFYRPEIYIDGPAHRCRRGRGPMRRDRIQIGFRSTKPIAATSAPLGPVQSTGVRVDTIGCLSASVCGASICVARVRERGCVAVRRKKITRCHVANLVPAAYGQCGTATAGGRSRKVDGFG